MTIIIFFDWWVTKYRPFMFCGCWYSILPWKSDVLERIRGHGIGVVKWHCLLYNLTYDEAVHLPNVMWRLQTNQSAVVGLTAARERTRKIIDRLRPSGSAVVYSAVSVATSRPRGSDFERNRKKIQTFFLLEIWAISDTFFRDSCTAVHYLLFICIYIILSVSGVYA